jgi:hypothetical protein
MFDFKSDHQKDVPDQVPFFEDTTASDGWQGHTTGKDLNTLKAEIMSAMARLGGIVSGFERGSFANRPGFRIHYAMETPNGKTIPGYIDIAALPLKPREHYRRGQTQSLERAQEQSLRMALFNVAAVLRGLYVMSRLSPGYIPLMPWMLAQDGKNLTQLWAERSTLAALMPPEDNDFVEGEDFIEGKSR